MKPASFQYLKPVSLEEAKLLLGELGEDAKILAGGQTLVPMLNFRLAEPSVIIDINEIPGLDYVNCNGEGLTLGALVRWHRIEESPIVAAANPLLVEAVKHVAHYQIRSRGTWAGSCAHADPAAEFQAVAIACGAEFGIHSVRGQRTVPAEDFFIAPLVTVLDPDEILVDVRFPVWPPSRRWAFEEFSFRSGDFAMAGIVALVDPSDEQEPYRLVCFGVGDKAIRLKGAEAVLASGYLTQAIAAQAAAQAATEVEPQDDVHGSADYRRALVEALAYSTVCKAAGLEVQL